MRGRVWTLSIAIVIALSPASAAGVSVDIGPTALLQPGAQAVTASVAVTCPARAPTDGIQENRLEVRQERRGTLVVGVGGTGNLVCDGKPHTYQITAQVEEATLRFGRGPAVANMFVLICSGTGATCLQGDVTEDVLIV
jgi:hypothetical protein